MVNVSEGGLHLSIQEGRHICVVPRGFLLVEVVCRRDNEVGGKRSSRVLEAGMEEEERDDSKPSSKAL